MQKTNLTENLSQEEGTKIFFIIDEAKEIGLDFSQRTLNTF